MIDYLKCLCLSLLLVLAVFVGVGIVSVALAGVFIFWEDVVGLSEGCTLIAFLGTWGVVGALGLSVLCYLERREE